MLNHALAHPAIYSLNPLCMKPFFWNIFQPIPYFVSRLSRVSGSHVSGSIIVHTIQTKRFLFDRTVSSTAICSQRKEGVVEVFILSKIKCFFPPTIKCRVTAYFSLENTSLSSHYMVLHFQNWLCLLHLYQGIA